MSPYIQAKFLALRQRLAHLAGRRFDPFPPPPPDVSLSPSQAHFALYGDAPLRLAWERAGIDDAGDWQRAARAKLAKLTGYAPVMADLAARHVRDHQMSGGFRRKSFYLGAGAGLDIPVSLVWHDDGAWPRPTMICLQGTNSGMHLSWGGARMPADPLKVAGGGDYARQAAWRGYLAVCVEQRGFGERAERSLPEARLGACGTASNHALLLGASLLGERAADVSTVVSWLIGRADSVGASADAIHIMGHSSGGSTALLAGALDTRIAGVMPCGCIGFMRETIARRPVPEGQNTIPGILNWLEMDDFVALCAPRPFLTVAGHADHIWPFAQADAVVESARRVYAALDAAERISAVAGPGGHRFYPQIAWDAYARLGANAG